jgi:hypothetical protein
MPNTSAYPSPALYPIVANGSAYNESDMVNLGYATNLPAAIAAVQAQLAKSFIGTTSTSVTVAAIGGTINLTTNTGLAYVAGQSVMLANQAAPATNFMAGTITSYNSSTGAMQFTIVETGGAGTYTSWYVTPCGFAAASTALTGNYGIVNSLLGTDQGGLGVPLSLSGGQTWYDAQRATGWLGLESPSNSMIEIFEEFQWPNIQTPDLTFGLTRYAAVGPPWFLSVTQYGFTGISPVGAEVQLISAPAASAFYGVQESILTYGNNGGFLHVGKGALIVEFRVSEFFGPLGQQVAEMRGGLSACGTTNPTTNIFGNGGIGFTVDINGVVHCVAGVSGNVTKQATSTNLNSGGVKVTRFRVEVDHIGTTANYYVDDVLVGTISGIIGGQGILNLMMPAFEVAAITSFYLAKYLMR